jgi:hypothetical protein
MKEDNQIPSRLKTVAGKNSERVSRAAMRESRT